MRRCHRWQGRVKECGREGRCLWSSLHHEAWPARGVRKSRFQPGGDRVWSEWEPQEYSDASCPWNLCPREGCFEGCLVTDAKTRVPETRSWLCITNLESLTSGA